ncbi:phage tail protein [Photobacterium sp. GJ3]|uniref:phage tail protein n=1 Tax=Photobacterium sp. GJ3 TaxID=2829502 RepID=UPI001B8B4071|nr:tail fiber protein [Photobacterium sp. GJ3]QUJ66497.1 phage tail protein [Photobacterium sp. GJ3]
MEPFIGNIQMFGANFYPRNYAYCNGQSITITQNRALYTLLGGTFGMVGETAFKLPDLRGRMPVHPGIFGYTEQQIRQGKTGGLESVSLTTDQLPAHTHQLQVSSQPGNSFRPYKKKSSESTVFASAENGSPVYAQAANLVPMSAKAMGYTGTGTAHDNMQPSTVINFCIALTGIFPDRD